MIDPQVIRAFIAHAMLTHPEQAKQIAAHAAADPEGTAELAAEYAATQDDDDDADAPEPDGDEPSDIDDGDDDDDSEIDDQPEPEPAKPAPSPVVKSVVPPVPGKAKGRRHR